MHELTVTSTYSAQRVQSTGWQTRRVVALAGIVGPALFVILQLFSDIIQYPFLVSNGFNALLAGPVSDNAWGPYGFVQTFNFAQIGILLLMFAVALDESSNARTRWRWFWRATDCCDWSSGLSTKFSPVSPSLSS